MWERTGAEGRNPFELVGKIRRSQAIDADPAHTGLVLDRLLDVRATLNRGLVEIRGRVPCPEPRDAHVLQDRVRRLHRWVPALLDSFHAPGDEVTQGRYRVLRVEDPTSLLSEDQLQSSQGACRRQAGAGDLGGRPVGAPHAGLGSPLTTSLGPGQRRVRRTRCSPRPTVGDRKSTRLNSSHVAISYAVFCLKKK